MSLVLFVATAKMGLKKLELHVKVSIVKKQSGWFFYNNREKSLGHVAMVEKFLDDNKPKTSLKKGILTVSNFIDLTQLHLIC